jgi:hypothetical protein
LRIIAAAATQAKATHQERQKQQPETQAHPLALLRITCSFDK